MLEWSCGNFGEEPPKVLGRPVETLVVKGTLGTLSAVAIEILIEPFKDGNQSLSKNELHRNKVCQKFLFQNLFEFSSVIF